MFQRHYQDVILPYLATSKNINSVVIAGDKAKCLNVSKIMMQIAFPGIGDITDVIVPGAPYESLVELGLVIYQGR